MKLPITGLIGKMKEQFNLSDRRKKLFDKANKEAESNEERASIVSIFAFIHNQDKEFIKRLKEDFDKEIHAEFEEEGSNIAFRANMVLNKVKDKLAGDELI